MGPYVGGGSHNGRGVCFSCANIIPPSHLLNYVSRIDAFLATLCHLPHHESIINESGASGSGVVAQVVRGVTEAPSVWITN